MCNFTVRVGRCGHYKKSLSTACEKAKKSKHACDNDAGTASTTGEWCGEFGCDRQPGAKQEGPGEL